MNLARDGKVASGVDQYNVQQSETSERNVHVKRRDSQIWVQGGDASGAD